MPAPTQLDRLVEAWHDRGKPAHAPEPPAPPESPPAFESEASLSEIARAAGVTVQAAWGRARRQGWPCRYITCGDVGSRGARRMRLFPLASLPEAARQAVLAARRGEDPPAIDDSGRADLAEIAAALGVSYVTAMHWARREEWPFDSKVPRSERELGRGGPSNLYPLACLPRWVRIAVLDRRSPDPDEPCARCGAGIPGNLLCMCARCGESVCAGCLDSEYCGQCRRELKARRRYSHRPRKAAIALARNRAARGEGVAA